MHPPSMDIDESGQARLIISRCRRVGRRPTGHRRGPWQVEQTTPYGRRWCDWMSRLYTAGGMTPSMYTAPHS
jgi:hypothetical protein